MSDEHPVRDALLEELAALIEPLAILSSADDVSELIRALGWDLPAITEVPDAFDLIVTGVDDVRGALGQLEAAATDDERKAAGSALLLAITEVLGGTAALAVGIEDGFAALGTFVTESRLAEELPRRLLDFVVLDYLLDRHRTVTRLLLFAGLVDFVIDDGTATPHRVETVIPTVHWERIPQLFSDPGAILEEVYGWSTDFLADKFLSRAMGLLASVGLPIGEFPQPTALADALHRPADPRAEYRAALLQTGGFVGPNHAEVGVRLSEVPADGVRRPGIALIPYADGTATFTGELAPNWQLVIATALDVTAGIALVLRPPDVLDFETDLLGGAAVVTGKLGIGIRRAAPPNTEWVLLGEAGKTRLAVRELSASLTGVLDTPPELIFAFDIAGLAIAIVSGDGDGFLQKVLPPNGIKANGDLGLDASTSTGFTFRGGGGFEIELPLKLSLGGVVELRTLWVQLHIDAEGLRFTLALTVVVKLGPVSGTVERIGIAATLVPVDAGQSGNLGMLDLLAKFKPPSGAGLAIAAGPVTGGGYIFFDPENEQYAGVLQLSFNTIGLTVIGLLTTRLPDPAGAPGATKQGFSLLLIIAFDLPPIQLGYGFTLNGVGGILGVNRTMVVEALRSGVRTGAVDSILFPSNPVARAAEIISDLRTIFPPAEGRYVFGPMVKIGWGPNALIELQAAVVLELMAPIRLVILGKVLIALPDKKDAVVKLRLDIVGVIDFDRSEVSVDASLVDSRIAAFTISGDMALRVGWGATKQFALAAGGFHPRFQPPAGFPELGRLAISLASGDNPRLRLESYFALTSNTLQFGAGLDIYAKVDTFVGTFSLSALANFDALIQFQPFKLMVDIGASVDIARNGAVLLHAALHADLSGPDPWHASGYAEFELVGKHRIAFEATIGEPAALPPLVVEVRELARRLSAALSRPDAWAALPPREGDRLATLRGQPTDRTLVHPLGALSVRQRELPFGKRIERFGSAIVDPVTFTLTSFTVGRRAQPPAALLRDDFAPGQYTPLTDDERLSRPAFESMVAGGSVDVSAFLLPADATAGVRVESTYEEATVDDEPALFTRVAVPHDPTEAPTAVLLDAALRHLTRGGSAAYAGTRRDGAADFVGASKAVGVTGERYVVAGRDDLTPRAGAPAAGTSSAEAYDALTGSGSQVTLLHEAGS